MNSGTTESCPAMKLSRRHRFDTCGTCAQLLLFRSHPADGQEEHRRQKASEKVGPNEKTSRKANGQRNGQQSPHRDASPEQADAVEWGPKPKRVGKKRKKNEEKISG